MAAITKFKPKYHEVRAEQFDGSHIPSLLLGTKYAYINYKGVLMVRAAQGTESAIQGDWVVQKPSGHYRVMTNHEFEDTYEPL